MLFLKLQWIKTSQKQIQWNYSACLVISMHAHFQSVSHFWQSWHESRIRKKTLWKWFYPIPDYQQTKHRNLGRSRGGTSCFSVLQKCNTVNDWTFISLNLWHFIQKGRTKAHHSPMTRSYRKIQRLFPVGIGKKNMHKKKVYEHKTQKTSSYLWEQSPVGTSRSTMGFEPFCSDVWAERGARCCFSDWQ